MHEVTRRAERAWLGWQDRHPRSLELPPNERQLLRAAFMSGYLSRELEEKLAEQDEETERETAQYLSRMHEPEGGAYTPWA
jgi:hypothetical protein